MHNEDHDNIIIDNSVENENNEPIKEIEEPHCDIVGVVTDCIKLNIRKKPDKNSEVVTIVDCLDKLNVYLDTSTDEWYAVRIASGLDGFCMKKYISIVH